MSKRGVIFHDSATSSSRREDREIEIQDWDRKKGLEQANKEKLELTEAHWEVVDFLRKRYIEKGDAENAREVARDLNSEFANKGGDKYLRRIFPGGPVTQGSRIAGLPVTAYSEDPSFGTTY